MAQKPEVNVMRKRTSDPFVGESVVDFHRRGETQLSEVFGTSPLSVLEMQKRLWDFVKREKLLVPQVTARESAKRSPD